MTGAGKMSSNIKRILLLIGAILLVLITLLWWHVSSRIQVVLEQPVYEQGEITCPFLAMAPPDASNLWTFAQGANANGQDLMMAVLVGIQVTYQQKGIIAALNLEAPDLRRLHEVPGVSHDDRFGLFLTELRPMAEEMAENGTITLQELADLKIWVAKRTTGSIISEPSRIETALAFIRAGGSQDTWRVSVEHVFTLLSGNIPDVKAIVTLNDMFYVMEQIDWHGLPME